MEVNNNNNHSNNIPNTNPEAKLPRPTVAPFGLSNNRMTRTIDFFDHPVQIIQDFGGDLGTTVWDAALVLTKYFENTEEFPANHFRAKKVIELGCGCGLPGIAVGMLGGQVWLTDRKDVISLAQENTTLNNLDKRVSCVAFEWTEKLEHFPPELKQQVPFDFILLSDLIANCYSEEYKRLISVLALLSSPKTQILMSYERRDKRELEFFQLLGKNGFSFSRIDADRLDPVWQAQDDIAIFSIYKTEPHE